MNWRALRRWLPLLIGVVLLGVIAALPVTMATENDTNRLAVPGPVQPIGGIYKGMTAVQEFPSEGTAINAVSLRMATYKRVNKGAFTVTVSKQTGDTWQEIGTRSIRKAEIKDNSVVTFTFDAPLPVARGQLVRITAQADGGAGDAVTWWVDPDARHDGFALTMNGKAKPGIAQFRVAYAQRTGRLIGMIGPVWSRITVFLSPFWRGLLAVGMCVLCASLLLLARSFPERAIDR